VAQVYEAQKDSQTAQTWFRRALSLYARQGETAEAQLGQAQALNFLAGYDFQRRRLALAEPQYLRAIELTERAESETSQRLLPLLDNLHALYRSQRRDAQALAVARRAERLRGGANGPGS
jgi:tetratricopeptide (TPR) repeat protein